MMPKNQDFEAVFERLKDILQPYEANLIVQGSVPGNYCLNVPYVEKYKKELMFGAAQINKNYVSFHLFPVYMYPDLLDGISPALKKRMQGKSCFNFTSIDDDLMAELTTLTQKGAERFRQEHIT
jgi:hypothetical protein